VEKKLERNGSYCCDRDTHNSHIAQETIDFVPWQRCKTGNDVFATYSGRMSRMSGGKTADAGTKRKIKEYERAYNIQQTDRSTIFFFFAVTSGGLVRDSTAL
jgi:hypothetical protein